MPDNNVHDAMKANPLRQRIAHILEADTRGDTVSRWIDGLLVLLIGSNVLAVVLESVASLHAKYETQFAAFEVFSVIVFTVEYFLRVWSSVEINGKYQHTVLGRLRFMLTPAAIIDLLAILPFYLSMFFALDLRFLRALRLVRVFKLTRYSSAMNILLNVFREERSAFTAAFFVLIILMVIASTGIYLIEHDVQPENFGSIPAAMWWAMATLTTVGYGDVTPITPLGKFFGGCITIVGIGMVALPAGILASGFSEQLHRAKETYSGEFEKALDDGVLDAKELQKLEELREMLGLTEEDVDDIQSNYLKRCVQHMRSCPHCHKPLVKSRRDDL
ncbi:MAG: ion transporter [Cellvibrionaceae bacterium]